LLLFVLKVAYGGLLFFLKSNECHKNFSARRRARRLYVYTASSDHDVGELLTET
jgi:hypothetical protein